MNEEIVIREIVPSDAAAIAALSAELGYPASAGEMKERIRALEMLPDHAIYAACLANRVVAWIDVSIVQHLASAPFGEIGGLVVSGDFQGRGIGALLVERAEQWVASRGVSKVVVRSRSTRESAHEFYRKQDFERWKTQEVFRKDLAL
jgi:GNAT superfamily N-acetyltransferase